MRGSENAVRGARYQEGSKTETYGALGGSWRCKQQKHFILAVEECFSLELGVSTFRAKNAAGHAKEETTARRMVGAGIKDVCVPKT